MMRWLHAYGGMSLSQQLWLALIGFGAGLDLAMLMAGIYKETVLPPEATIFAVPVAGDVLSAGHWIHGALPAALSDPLAFVLVPIVVVACVLGLFVLAYGAIAAAMSILGAFGAFLERSRG